MKDTMSIRPNLPPRRNELGAQLNRLQTLGRETLDASTNLHRLNMRAGRQALHESLAGMNRLLTTNSVPQLCTQSVEQYMAQSSALGAYLSAAVAIMLEMQTAWRTWSDAALSNANEQCLRQLSSVPERYRSWGERAVEQIEQTMGATSSLSVQAPPPSDHAEGLNGTAAPHAKTTASTHQVSVR